MPTPLTRYYARQNIARVTPHLTSSFRDLAQKLLDALGDDGRVSVATLHYRLFEEAGTASSANASLNRLIATVNTAAVANEIPVRIAITKDKKAGPKGRYVWFEGDDTPNILPNTDDLKAVPSAVLQKDQRAVLVAGRPIVLLTFNEHETRAVEKIFAPEKTLRPETVGDGLLVNDLGVHGGMFVKHVISRQGRLEAQTTAHRVLAQLQPCAIIAVGIAFGVDEKKQQIGDTLIADQIFDYEGARVNPDGSLTRRNRTGLPDEAFLARARQLEHTAKHLPTLRIGTLVCGDKLIDNKAFRDSILKSVPEAIGGEMEAAGIEGACRQPQTPWLVVKAICDWADGQKNKPTKAQDQALAATHAATVVKALLDFGPLDPRPRAPVPTIEDLKTAEGKGFNRDMKARPVSLNDPRPTDAAAGEEGISVLPYLHAWAQDLDAPPLLALLGEYGMGKTVTCQQFWQDLSDRHRRDAQTPLPLYFDLRKVPINNGGVPSLEQTLQACIHNGWINLGETYTPAQVQGWIDTGATVIVDGLDEVLVKLDGVNGPLFTQNILKLFDDARARAERAGKECRLKLLIACRTAYFPTLRDQNNHFTQQKRGNIKAEHYRALMLLPWAEEQVQTYLRHALPDLSLEQITDLTQSLHGVQDLAARPFTLRLIAEFAPHIEARRAAGEKVSAVTLYRMMAESWLDRDAGKHHILPDHKLILVRHLAAHLWTTGKTGLAATDLQNWFHHWWKKRDDFIRYTQKTVDHLEEDLRTATFLSRRDLPQNKSEFSFAHTSLQEFFLAEFLLEALHENQPDAWAMAVPSQETLDFLGQMLSEAPTSGALETLASWRTETRPKVNALLFAYALRARAKGWPCPDLRGIRLDGANLRGARIGGGEALWDLSGAVFTGADLREAEFSHTRLTKADFCGAALDRACFTDAHLAQARFDGATLSGTIFRRCDVTDSHWNDAVTLRTQMQFCTPAMAWDDPEVLRVPEPGAESAGHLAWLPGHSGGVNACAWSADGRLASASDDGTLRLWDPDTGACLATLTGHVGGVNACAWSADGRLASAGSDSTLRLWDPDTGTCLATLTGHADVVNACAWSADGRLASAGDDGTLRVWNPDAGTCLATLTGHDGMVLTCAWSADGRLASAEHSGTLRVWNPDTGTCLATLSGHTDWVRACAWSADGRLASIGDDGTIRLWNPNTGTCLATLTGHEGVVHACAWSADGRLASAGQDSIVRLWDPETGTCLTALTGHDGWVRACAWSADRRLASGGYDGTLLLWDTDTATCLATVTGLAGGVFTCDWLTNGGLASTGRDGTLGLWDPDTGSCLATVTGLAGMANTYAWSADGRLASAGFDGVLRLWDPDTRACLATITEHKGGVFASAWSAEGRLASAGFDGTVRVWNPDTGTCLATLIGHEGWVFACAWSTDGRLASAGYDGTLRLWDPDSVTCLATLTGHEDWVRNCAWSADGRLASAGKDGTLRLWDTDTGTCLATLTGHAGGVLDCAWSADGCLASAGRDGTLRLWDLDTGTCLATLTGHSGEVNACAWSADGRLASAGDDGTLRVWNPDTGECLFVAALWKRPAGTSGHVAWSPVENRVLSGSDDAWRFLAWQVPDAQGRLTRLPLETFGALPLDPPAYR